MATKAKTRKKTAGEKAVKKKIGETINFKRDNRDNALRDGLPGAFWKLRPSHCTTIAEYLKTGMSAHSVDGDPLLVSERGACLYLLHNHKLYEVGSWLYEFDQPLTTFGGAGAQHSKKASSPRRFLSFTPLATPTVFSDGTIRDCLAGVLIPSKRKGYKFFFIQQADDEDNTRHRRLGCQRIPAGRGRT